MPVEFGADDGFDAGLRGGLGEFDCAVKVVFVSESDGRELVMPGEVNDGVDREGGVEEGVATVEVERNE